MALTIKVELDEVTKKILSIKDATTDKELATPTDEELVDNWMQNKLYWVGTILHNFKSPGCFYIRHAGGWKKICI